MIKKTYSSDLISTIKLPRNTNLKVEFVYNFFEKDETVSEGIRRSNPIALKQSRYNRLTFNRPELDEKITTKVEDKNKILSNIQNIYSSEDIGNTSNTTLVTQNTQLIESLYQLLMRSATIKNISGNMTDISMKLAESLPELNSADKDKLQDLCTSFESAGAVFIKGTSTLQSIKFENFSTSNTNVIINDKFLADLLESAERNSWMGNSTAHGLKLKRANILQNKARNDLYTITESDYDTTLVPVDIEEKVSSTEPEIKFIGTLVYRQEIFPDGHVGDNSTRLIDVLPIDAVSYNDYQIKIDANYSYWLHALYEIKIESISIDNPTVLLSTIYFQSAPSDAATINTIDNTPPSPPVQFDINWDYQFYNVVLHWNFPVCRTRDIKYFQIYRRKNLYEPFELIQEYDFNDSEKLPNRVDGILQNKVKKVEIPLKHYVDNTFKKDSRYIYAITCMDARGLISNYSCQIEVSFDIIKNKLIKKIVSKSGAPIQYPNVFLEEDFFLDIIRTNKKNKMIVYFDPEYLKIKASSGNEIDGVVTSDTGSYSISILDVNRAQFVSIPIKINDLQEK